MPGSTTNPYSVLPAADFTTPIAPQRLVLGTPYASYTAYCTTGMFFDNYYGGTVPGIGNFQFSQPLFALFFGPARGERGRDAGVPSHPPSHAISPGSCQRVAEPA